jgi:hypothetical protein
VHGRAAIGHGYRADGNNPLAVTRGGQHIQRTPETVFSMKPEPDRAWKADELWYETGWIPAFAGMTAGWVAGFAGFAGEQGSDGFDIYLNMNRRHQLCN